MTSNSGTINKILATGSRHAADDTREYRSYVEDPQRQDGFVITCSNGHLHAMNYLWVRNLEVEHRNGSDILNFTHESKAVVIKGEKLGQMLRAMVRRTLSEIIEPDGRPALQGMPVIHRLEVHDTSKEKREGAGEASARLVKAG